MSLKIIMTDTNDWCDKNVHGMKKKIIFGIMYAMVFSRKQNVY